jgi:hypothetical protein
MALAKENVALHLGDTTRRFLRLLGLTRVKWAPPYLLLNAPLSHALTAIPARRRMRVERGQGRRAGRVPGRAATCCCRQFPVAGLVPVHQCCSLSAGAAPVPLVVPHLGVARLRRQLRPAWSRQASRDAAALYLTCGGLKPHCCRVCLRARAPSPPLQVPPGVLQGRHQTCKGLTPKQQPGTGDATCGHRRCYQRPPHLPPASTAIATCDHRRYYRRPRLWLHTTTAVATYGHRRCYRRPPPLRPGATAVATRGHRCYIRPPPMLPAVTAVAPGSCRCCY